jgi:hypothetical protein
VLRWKAPSDRLPHMMAQMAVHILVLHSRRRLRERDAHGHAAPQHYEDGHNRQ